MPTNRGFPSIVLYAMSGPPESPEIIFVIDHKSQNEMVLNERLLLYCRTLACVFASSVIPGAYHTWRDSANI